MDNMQTTGHQLVKTDEAHTPVKGFLDRNISSPTLKFMAKLGIRSAQCIAISALFASIVTTSIYMMGLFLILCVAPSAPYPGIPGHNIFREFNASLESALGKNILLSAQIGAVVGAIFTVYENRSLLPDIRDEILGLVSRGSAFVVSCGNSALNAICRRNF